MLNVRSSFLLRAQAQVQVVAETLSPALADLAARQALSWRATEFSDSLVDDVFLVIAATEDEALNQRVFAAANARYRLVNVVDNQALCSFVFPSIVDRSPLLVAISSSGKAPVLSRILREKIEALLPTNLGRLAESASYWRKPSENPPDDHRSASPLLGARLYRPLRQP
ncbi:siroheme synthase [Klebsiella pneumoniae]|uniref:precorrin-2 dehydrogenase n=1 Tax=Klebsiella pneumoniae TaxID=573 RepID=A0A378FMW1_KLEPN|nr:siroheme synthase [Klebsiella pneumoniae]